VFSFFFFVSHSFCIWVVVFVFVFVVSFLRLGVQAQQGKVTSHVPLLITKNQ